MNFAHAPEAWHRLIWDDGLCASARRLTRSAWNVPTLVVSMSLPSGNNAMMPSPISTVRRHTIVNAALLGAALMLACSSAAEAASAPTVPPASRPVQTAMLTAEADGPAATPPAQSAEPDMLCRRVRKRFWIEGEGWMVRRVSACR